MVQSLRSIDHVEDLLDRLRLDATARSRGAVVVEGPNDADVLSEVFSEDSLTFFPVDGRANVIEAAERLGDHYLSGVICVADADFDDEVNIRATQWFLVFTDNADLDTMCYASPALERVLAAWGSRTKLAAYGGVASVRASVADVVRPLSVLRRANALGGHCLRFDAIDLHTVVTKDPLELRTQGLIDRLASVSSVSVEKIAELLEGEEPVCFHTGSLLMRGRDCLTVVDIALRKVVGNLAHQQVKDGLARRSLVLAIRAADLATTPFVERVRAAAARALATPDG